MAEGEAIVDHNFLTWLGVIRDLATECFPNYSLGHAGVAQMQDLTTMLNLFSTPLRSVETNNITECQQLHDDSVAIFFTLDPSWLILVLEREDSMANVTCCMTIAIHAACLSRLRFLGRGS